LPEPNAMDRPWRTYEFVFLFSKSRSYNFDRTALEEAKVEDVWTIESRPLTGRDHPAAFPQELVRRCLAIGNPNGGPTLDPFVGSGTVLRTALALGSDADGIDLNKEYCCTVAAELSSM
jgi:DNA modification methylase